MIPYYNGKHVFHACSIRRWSRAPPLYYTDKTSQHDIKASNRGEKTYMRPILRVVLSA